MFLIVNNKNAYNLLSSILEIERAIGHFQNGPGHFFLTSANTRQKIIFSSINRIAFEFKVHSDPRILLNSKLFKKKNFSAEQRVKPFFHFFLSRVVAFFTIRFLRKGHASFGTAPSKKGSPFQRTRSFSRVLFETHDK